MSKHINRLSKLIQIGHLVLTLATEGISNTLVKVARKDGELLAEARVMLPSDIPPHILVAFALCRAHPHIATDELKGEETHHTELELMTMKKVECELGIRFLADLMLRATKAQAVLAKEEVALSEKVSNELGCGKLTLIENEFEDIEEVLEDYFLDNSEFHFEDIKDLASDACDVLDVLG